MQKSHGQFIYGDSLFNGFALVHVTRHNVDVKYYGVHYLNETEAAAEDKAIAEAQAAANTTSTNTTDVKLMQLNSLTDEDQEEVELEEEDAVASDEIEDLNEDEFLPEIEEEEELNDSDEFF